jgi:sugar phosphate isomerase/epimerase
MKSMRIGVSTWVYVTASIEEALTRIHGAGIRYVELWGNTPTHLDPVTHPRARAIEVAAVLKALDVTPVALHAPFVGLDLASVDDDVRSVSVASALRSVEFCRALACPQLLLHLSASPGVKGEAAVEAARRAMVESLEEITDHARQKGVTILLENMASHPSHLRVGSMVRELLELVNRFQDRGIGICIDTGHSSLNQQDPSEDIRQAGCHLRSLHINDNDGVTDGHLVPGRGRIEWPAVLAALREVEYRGVFLFEINGDEGARETVDQAIAFARRFLE